MPPPGGRSRAFLGYPLHQFMSDAESIHGRPLVRGHRRKSDIAAYHWSARSGATAMSFLDGLPRQLTDQRRRRTVVVPTVARVISNITAGSHVSRGHLQAQQIIGHHSFVLGMQFVSISEANSIDFDQLP